MNQGFARALATFALASVGVLALPVTSASAHDSITQTYPSSEQTVEAGQFEVSITFNDKILSTENNAGLAIQVSGPIGTKRQIQSVGCVHTGSKEIATPVNLDLPGTYRVKWRSVSSDGHPTEGQFEFKLKNSKGYVAAGLPKVNERCVSQKQQGVQTASPSETAAPTETAVSSPNSSQDPETSESGTKSDLLPALGVAALLVIAGSIAGAMRGNRSQANNGKSGNGGKNQNDQRYE